MTLKTKIRVIILITIIILAVLYLLKFKHKTPEQTVKIAAPAYGNIQTFITATAVVQPQNRLEIKPPISGRIEEILVKEGDKVESGQILAWMSSTDRAALLDAAMAQGEDAVKYWEKVYKPTPLLSPIKGEIIVSTKEKGQTITAQDIVVVISDFLIVQAQVDETDIGKVKLGQNAVINLDAYPEIKINGIVNHVYYESKTINNVTIYQVDILPEIIPEVFRSGMSATVNIIENSKENILLLPIEAVLKDNKESYVYVSRNNNEKPLEKKVVTGIYDEKNCEIISGITPQDKVLIISKKYNLKQDKQSKNNPFLPSRRSR